MHRHGSALPSPGGMGIQLRLVPCVGTDHWAARRDRLPSFGHFRQIRIAYQRCVRVAAPYEARGHGTTTAKNEP